MNSFKYIKLLVIGLLSAVCINSNAFDFFRIFKGEGYKVDYTVFQIGVIGNLFDTDNVYGLALAFPVSSNKNNYGLATGIWGRSAKHCGIQFNAVNLANELNGLQVGLAGIISAPEEEASTGVQLNVFYNLSETLFGIQGGLVNQSGRLNGTQLGFVNIADQGVQFGVVNVFNSRRMLEGMNSYQSDAQVQVGLYNHSANRSTFQFGVLNYNKDSLIPYFPIFNFSTD
ncbi:MAG: hypothetical protein PHV59_03285 [Victivallales bacterium]|nr:hypothetical protein [Victivallales bacterium]